MRSAATTLSTPFVPEERLVIACSRGALDEAAVGEAAAVLEGEVDWPYVVAIAVRHGVAPLCAAALDQLAAAGVDLARIPDGVARRLRALRDGSARRNRRLFRVVAELASAFTRAGVDAVGLKDLQLAREVYPEPGLRPLGDLDILIRREQYEVAARTLATMDFRPLPHSDIPYTLRYAWAHHFRRASDDVWVDLQWGLLQREWDVYGEGKIDLEIDRLWRRTRPLALGDGIRLLVPQPEEMLYHLCLHAEGHGYAELILLCDIAELLRHEGDRFDWDHLLKVATQQGVRGSLQSALRIAGRMVAANVPADVLASPAGAFFEASLTAPLFGGLTPLHLSLDEIRLAAAPPEGLLDEWETLTRRQARAAMGLAGEVRALVADFLAAGGGAVAAAGSPSLRVFPSAALPPFEELQLLVPDAALPMLRRLLPDLGFVRDGRGLDYTKRLVLPSSDPVLGEAPTTLELNVEIAEGGIAPVVQSVRTTRRSIARRLLRARQSDSGATAVGARIRFVGLGPEDALVAAGATLAAHANERLFVMCALRGLIVDAAGRADLPEVLALARRQGVDQAVAHVLSLQRWLDGLESDELGSVRSTAPVIPLRMLEWARYGAGELAPDRGFKRAFFVCLVWRDLGWGDRLHYLARLLLDRNARRVLPLATRDVAGAALRRARPQPQLEIAYWVEEPALLTLPGAS